MRYRATLLALSVSAAAQQQCQEAEAAAAAPENVLSNGLTHLWTTPVLRYQLLKAGHVHLRSLEEAVLARYQAFSANCSARRPGETASDAWFAEQRDAFERGEPGWLEEDSGASAALRALRGAWLSNTREYIGAAVGAETADEFFEDPSAIRMFVWAAVHERCSLHTPHVHQESAVSGVFYVSVPERSGHISFDDPRGLRPPFAANRLVHTPSAGELLLFPPWLVHGVAPSCDAAGPRIALSFNLMSTAPPEGTGGTDPNWEVLADASVVMSAEG